MKKIGLIQISFKRQGGVIYRNQVLDSLKERFNVESIDCSPSYLKNIRYLKLPESFAKLFFLKGGKDLWIRDFFSTAIFSKKTKGKNLSILFHIDFSGFPVIARPFFYLIEKLFFWKNIKKIDAIVVISDYWEKYFLGKGFKNIYKAYCGFDLDQFKISDKEVEDFKKQNNLIGKPIVYIGNCQEIKGVKDVYEALKGLDVYLVSSGRKEVNIPVLNFDTSYKDYLRLLKASNIVVTMSKFKEGWCMTAHEAMLCKTPVIGSGLGGMRELLMGGNQIVCNNFKDIKNKVEYLINNKEEREKIGITGYEFAKEFSQKRFKESWENIVEKVLL